MRPDADALHLIPLGGLGEVGMNAMLLGTSEGRILLDCGVTFAGIDADLGVRPLGVSIIHPDFEAALNPRPGHSHEVLRAIVLTHGHEDHIGALPYLLRDLELPLPPVFGPPYALELAKQRLEEMRVEMPAMHPIAVGETFEAGPFAIEPYHVNHSIVDAMGLILQTPAGVVVHSGDFKIEDVPADAPFPSDRLEALGDEGVSLLLSDSTNSFSEGRSGDEKDAAEVLERLIADQPHRVVVALFASNVHRMRAAFAAARKHGRRVLLLGRSVRKHFELARELGHLKNVSDLVARPKDAQSIPRDELLVLATGTQGEPPAALSKLARGEHRDLDLEAGDTVIMSSRIIPGLERSVFAVRDDLARLGITVLHRRSDPGVHVSGHAYQGEQRMLIEWLRPKCFLPVHGTYGMMQRHAQLARDTGVENVLSVENGAVVELKGGELSVVGEVPSGRGFIAHGGVRVDELMRRDRIRMGELGMIAVALPVQLKRKKGRLTGPPRLEARGFLPEEAEDELLDECTEYLRDDFRRFGHEDETLEAVEDRARRVVRRFFWKNLRRKPEVVPIAIEQGR
jgi:ribonuclease J